MFGHLTKITRAALQGKAFTGERDATDNRRLNPRKSQRADTAKAPRTRPGASFPGGKHLRKALTRLSARRNAFANPDDSRNKNTPSRKNPGSMTK
jgi:hypothetical protein